MAYLVEQSLRSWWKSAVDMDKMRISGLKAMISFLYNLRILNCSAVLIGFYSDGRISFE